MGLFRKRKDPIRDHARQIEAEIAALQGEIQALSQDIDEEPKHPRYRSSANPPSAASSQTARTTAPAEPYFENVDHERIKSAADPGTTPGHFNELGVRKYDLPALIRRFINLFRAAPPSNPKLVNYLAAGSIQGLRPLRYEKRVARNRFIGLVVLLLLILWGILAAFYRN